jgi:DNA invertase Pin-like site-specific DNA recombinase
VKQVAFYLRCSTDQQTVALQRRDLFSLAARHSDWHVVEYVDEGVSGSKSRRPALDRLMADVKHGKIDVVVVWRFDRFARSVSHLLAALEQFQALNVDFISYSEAIDTSSAIGRMTFTVLAAVAELEKQIIIERVRAGQQAAKARGVHCGRPKADTSERNAQIASLRKQGLSLRTIATELGLSAASIHRGLQSVAVARTGHQ